MISFNFFISCKEGVAKEENTIEMVTSEEMEKLSKMDDVEVLEDLILAAINDARTKVEEKSQEEMQKLTGGLGLPPGLTLPF